MQIYFRLYLGEENPLKIEDYPLIKSRFPPEFAFTKKVEMEFPPQIGWELRPIPWHRSFYGVVVGVIVDSYSDSVVFDVISENATRKSTKGADGVGTSLEGQGWTFTDKL